MSAQRVLVLPVASLLLLARQHLGVADLARAHPQVAHHGHEVEPDLRQVVAGDAAPQHLHDLGRELVVRRAGAVADGRRLQAVELVQRAVDGRVRDEVERVLGLAARALRLVDERAALREAVVHVADQLAVAERLAPELGRQHHRELAELAQRLADIDAGTVRPRATTAALFVLVQEHRQQRLCATRILDRLCREEDALRGVVVESPVKRFVCRCVGGVRRVFEEEDDAVDGV